MKKKILVNGMSCGHCVKHVKDALEELQGVTEVEVDLSTKTALMEYTGEVDDNKIKEAIEDAGYEVEKIDII